MNRSAALGSALLVVLGALAALLSVLALRSNDAPPNVQALPIPSMTASQGAPPPATEPAPVTDPTPSATSVPSTSPSPSLTTSPGQGPIVILGDRYSAEADSSWTALVAKQLGWTKVVNLAAPGRGYVAEPYRCNEDPCTPFLGTLEQIVAAAPATVIVFGGAADGDRDIASAASKFFAQLRQELPDAHIVALSPISTDVQPPDWMVQHRRSIRTAVEAVEGTFVDVGQPALGDGQELSEKAQAEIADVVVRELS